MIACRSLSHRYGSAGVLHGLDFEVPAGGLAVLLGPNGAGKTTTLRLLSGLLRPPPGTVLIDGFDVAFAPPELKARMGVVPDRLALLEHLCLDEHVEAFGPVYGLAAEEASHRGEQLVHLLALEPSRYIPLGSASHGTRKKAALLLALLHAPRVLLLDEPFEGLDPVAGRAVFDLLLRHSQGGATVLFTSHTLTVAERLATHVLLLDEGRLVWGAPARELPAPLEDFYFERIAAPVPSDLSWLAPGH